MSSFLPINPYSSLNRAFNLVFSGVKGKSPVEQQLEESTAMAFYRFNLDNPSYIPVMKRVLGQVRYYLGESEHKGGFTTLELARDKGLLKDKNNVVVLNADTHSDIYFLNDEPSLGIASWVNKSILHHPEISEVIWVMSPEIADKLKNKPFEVRMPRPGMPGKPVIGYTPHHLLLIDRKNMKIYFEPSQAPNPEQCDPVTLRCITADQLPNLKNRDVYLSLDMDYFSNVGCDTYEDTKVPYKGSSAVKDLFELLDKSNVRPFLANTSMSPLYSYLKIEPGKNKPISPHTSISAMRRYISSGIDKSVHPLLEEILYQIEDEFRKACRASEESHEDTVYQRNLWLNRDKIRGAQQ